MGTTVNTAVQYIADGKNYETFFEDTVKPKDRDKPKMQRRRREQWDKAEHKYNATQVAEDTVPVIGGVVEDPAARRMPNTAKTLVFTCMQNNTLIHEGFFRSLLTYCTVNNAELHVSRFTYNKGAYSKNSVKPGSKKNTDEEDLWYDHRVGPYVSDESVQITDDLVWCGELNLIPTLVNPISGFQNYTRGASCIIPHTKVAMESVATMKDDPAKFVYTTGCITQRNYIQKAAGQKADFHHVYGALVVEIDDDGTWWARQLNACDDGSFADLKWCYDGADTYEERPLAITHGDIHWAKRDDAVLGAVFKHGGILDELQPQHQFFHDLVDFTPRNHHNMKDWHHFAAVKFDPSVSEDVSAEFREAADYLYSAAHRGWCDAHVVTSNHDQAIELWLKNTSVFYDSANVELWLTLNTQYVHALKRGDTPRPFRDLLVQQYIRYGAELNWQAVPQVIHEDQSFKLAGIEMGMHGHLGPNGARGAPRNLRLAGKANTGHTHSAGIVEGVYTAGVYGKLDMGYNKGLSSWSHSAVLTYQNGKRCILTMKKGRMYR